MRLQNVEKAKHRDAVECQAWFSNKAVYLSGSRSGTSVVGMVDWIESSFANEIEEKHGIYLMCLCTSLFLFSQFLSVFPSQQIGAT